MDEEQKTVQDVLDRIGEYLEGELDETIFRTMFVPVMLKSIDKLHNHLIEIEKQSYSIAKQYWEKNACNRFELKKAKDKLLKHKSDINIAENSTEYYRVQAISKVMYLFEDWEDEAENSLAYFGSDLLNAGISLNFFYQELRAMFKDML